MGTNYYAKIIPSKKRKKELHDAIEADDFSLIRKLTEEMYGNFNLDLDTEELEGGKVHLGKRSGGWKFLWNPNIYVKRNGHLEDSIGGRRFVHDPDTPVYLYPLTKKGIKAFIDREDVLIYDEYGEQQDKDEFFKMALEWITWNGKEAWDAASYEKDNPNERKWVCSGELINLLEKEGYKFSSITKSDFYSDGLRFSTSTEFC